MYSKARSLTMQDSLSDNRITCFYKDKTGFVWIGTKNGLNRYDGHRMLIFRPAAGNSISNEVINDIAEDSRGMIWVATMNGLNKYDPLKNYWECLLPEAIPSDNDIPSNLVWDIAVDEQDRIWIASDVFQFSCYQPATKRFTYFDWPAFVKDNPRFSNGKYNSIKKFILKNKNEILLASNKALVSLNIATKSFHYLAGNYRSDIHDMRYDAENHRLYLSIEKGILLAWDENSGQLTETTPIPEPYPSQRFTMPGKKEIWMASENGLIRIDRESKLVSLTRHIPELSGSLQPGGISAIMQNADNIHWVGTSNGVSIYDMGLMPSLFLPLLPASDKESINRMGGVYFNKEREMYFVCATEASAVFLIHKKTGAIEKITVDAEGNPFVRCNTVKVDNENNLWLLTENHVYRYDDKANAFFLFPTPNKSTPVVFRDMVQDADGNYWFGSFHNGLYYYLTKEKRFVQPAGKGFDHLPTVTALYSDQKRKNVWIGTFSIGLYCYSLQQKKLTGYLETEEHPEYSALNLVQDITPDASGAIWVATQSGGLFRFTDNKGQVAISHYNMKTGLDDNSFVALASSPDSLVWALSGKGMLAITSKGRMLSHPYNRQTFSFSSFISDVRFPHKIFYEKENNELLVGVGGGLLIHLNTISKKLFRLPVVLTGISINGEQVLFQDIQKPGKKTLLYDKNNLQFEFAKLYYGSANDFTVEYRLDGWDEAWKTTQDLSASYQNLSPGTYQFQVRIKNAEGLLVGSAQSFSILIEPPFWQRWWAIAIMASLVALLIYFLLKRRINTINKKAALRQQLTELEAKALRAQMNPHFIFNSLNAIQELIVTQDVDAAYNYLSKFSKLLRLVLNNSEKATILLADEIHMLQLYLELESLRFRKSFAYNIHIDPTIDAESLLVPPLLLQPFIENALWHGLMLKEGDRKLILAISQQHGQVICTIDDNGIGRKRASEIKAQKIGAMHFESKGLKLSEQRIQLLDIKGQSGKVEIEDLYEDNAASGTRVIIHLPLINN